MTRLAFVLLLALGACGKVQPCRFKVGDTVRTITGEQFVVKNAEDGQSGGIGSHEPSYVLTRGTGWRIGFDKDGVSMSRGTYSVRESEIVEVVK